MEQKDPEGQKIKGRTLIILILGSLMTVTPFSIDLYLPAFKEMAADFDTTPARLSLTITSYFVGFALGQLLYGPLLDRFGRKKPLYIGLIVHILTSFGCMLSQSIEIMIVFRFLQALGGCVAGVAAMAMVRDFFPVKETAKILSLLILILGLSPLLAPTIGGFIAASLGWQWVFIILIILTTIVLALVFFFLPSKYKPDTTVSLHARPMLNTFWDILKVPQFYTYTLSGAFSFSTLFTYVTASPVIFLDGFKVSPQWYGGIFALLSVGFLSSNHVNISLLKKFKSEQIYGTALLCQVIINAVFFLGVWAGWFGLVGTIVMFFLSLMSIGLTNPNSSALSIIPFTKNVGSAAALLGFLQIGVATVISSCVGLLNTKDRTPLIAIMMLASLVAYIVLLVGRRKVIVAPETSSQTS